MSNAWEQQCTFDTQHCFTTKNDQYSTVANPGAHCHKGVEDMYSKVLEEHTDVIHYSVSISVSERLLCSHSKIDKQFPYVVYVMCK